MCVINWSPLVVFDMWLWAGTKKKKKKRSLFVLKWLIAALCQKATLTAAGVREKQRHSSQATQKYLREIKKPITRDVHQIFPEYHFTRDSHQLFVSL